MPTSNASKPAGPHPGAAAAADTDLAAFAHHLADIAGAAILPLFRSRLDVVDKATATDRRPFDPVTAADRAAEEVMRAAIKQAYPDHGIIGEEFGNEGAAAVHQWVLDPIDGTRAFILGLPVWGTLIGLTRSGGATLGMMDQPFTRERYWAADGKAWYRGPDRDAVSGPLRLATRACPHIADAQLSATHPELFQPGVEDDGFARVRRSVRATRYGGDCYAYCLLAAGHLDLVVEAGLKPYDVVALIPIIEAAGGVITTWDGKPATSGGRIVAAGDPTLHARAMDLLADSA